MPPILVCLNLQRRHTNQTSRHYVPRAPHVLPAIVACLGWARRRRLTIVHVHSGDIEGSDCLPIAGCEPKPSEILLFKRGRSFFDHAEFGLHGALRGRRAIVIGFTSGSDCIAAAHDAGRHGAGVLFVEDAISSNVIAGHSPQAVDDILSAVLSEFANLTRLDELLAHELSPIDRPRQLIGHLLGE